jgi:tRNA(adenine34) deaminase
MATAPNSPRDVDGWMQHALQEAALALDHDDVPVGAIVVHLPTGEIVARAHNARERDHDPTAHAEILALQAAARRAGSWRLGDHALVVTLEPCPMCAGAAWAARVPLIVFGAADPKGGAAGSLYNFAADPRLNHDSEVVRGVRAAECGELLSAFFRSRRSS